MGGFQSFEGLDAVQAWQPYIQQHATEYSFVERGKTFLTRSGGGYLQALVFEYRGQRLPDSLFVVDHEY
jgi:hypothetical protein